MGWRIWRSPQAATGIQTVQIALSVMGTTAIAHLSTRSKLGQIIVIGLAFLAGEFLLADSWIS